MFHLVMTDLNMQTDLVMVGPFLTDRQDRLGKMILMYLKEFSYLTICITEDTQVIQFLMEFLMERQAIEDLLLCMILR